eukprot:TRINITY_DN1474_c1_g1_i1.p1 TRINITY_DN1474_c1_g1~~TRINITY_DN1474_c1_g1_i1.p1  ORF type:complete len:662 (-),score=250.61 TRINITY_DN1474_c1_g1_i1:410-2395(-)
MRKRTRPTKGASTEEILRSTSSFVDELWSLRDSHSDVRLVSSEGESISGHQALLSLSSPFLKRLFREEGIREGKMNPELCLLLHDTSKDTILSLLEVLYTGKTTTTHLHSSKEAFLELEALARMLQISLPPLEPPEVVEPTRCIHCGIKFERLRPLKRHLNTCQRAGATPQLLCLRSCSKPCRKKQHQVPEVMPEVVEKEEEEEEKNDNKKAATKKEDGSDDDSKKNVLKESSPPHPTTMKEASPPKKEASPPKKEASPPKKEASPPKKEASPPKKEASPPPDPINKEEASAENDAAPPKGPKRKKPARPDGGGPKKRGKKSPKEDDPKSSSAVVVAPSSVEHGCPLCENTYASPSLLREHLCAHFKDELWLIIKGFSSVVTNCAICFKEFRKPVIKNVVVRHYGITHLYIRNYLDAEVFDEYFSGQKKAMEKRALKMSKAAPFPSEAPPPRSHPTLPPRPENKPILAPHFARKSAPAPGEEGGVIFSLGNEIRGFMDNDAPDNEETGTLNGAYPTNGGPSTNYRSMMEEVYSSESSYDAAYTPLTASSEDQGANRTYTYPDYYSGGEPSTNNPPPPGSFYQTSHPAPSYTTMNGNGVPPPPSSASDQTAFYSEHLNFFDGATTSSPVSQTVAASPSSNPSSYYPPPPPPLPLEPDNRLPS